MDVTRFDHWTRMLSTAASRRRTLGALALGLMGIGVTGEESDAGPGCKNVNAKCNKAKDCCSGLCKGKKGKKRCKAHDTGGCRAGQPEDACLVENIECTSGAGFPGICATTTGNAGYCFAREGATACQRDADCRAEMGPRAACVICALAAGGTLCVGPDNPV